MYLKETWTCDSNWCGLLTIRGLFSTLYSILPESDFFVVVVKFCFFSMNLYFTIRTLKDFLVSIIHTNTLKAGF